MLELDKVHNTDCFSAATQIDDQGVDVILTDPPYPNRMNLFDDTLVDGLAMLYLGCKKAKKYVVFFWNPFDVPPPPPGWHEVARHIWHKPDCKSITHYEVVIVWSKEAKQKVSRVWSIPILDYRSLRDWKPHPTQKPVRLLRYLLEQYTQEGEIVLDPFLGSGTTAVACQQMKRHFIGIEISAEYAQIATSRLKEPKKEEERVEATPAPTADEESVTPEEMAPEGTAPGAPAPASPTPVNAHPTRPRRKAPQRKTGPPVTTPAPPSPAEQKAGVKQQT